MIRVDCEHCGAPFDVADSMAGGLANCPGCGKATPVRGLRDPYYRLLQIGWALGVALLIASGWWAGGWPVAIMIGIGSAIVTWLVYLSL